MAGFILAMLELSVVEASFSSQGVSKVCFVHIYLNNYLNAGG